MAQHYDLRRLMLLRTVAQAGSLTTAARELTFTTSAVSQQIATLEREVGVPLLDREPRGVRLTEAGAVLVRYAADIDRTLAAARSDMEDFAGLRRGRLRIGTFPTVAATLVPPVIMMFKDRHPGVELEIRSAREAGIVDMLLRHDVEFGNLWDYPWAPVSAEALTFRTLMIDPTMLAVPEGHRLARRRSVDLADLAEEPWVTRVAHPVAEVLERVCRDAGFEPTVAFAANDYPELLGMVAAGIGVALAPRLALQGRRADVRMLSLKGNPAPRRILVAWPRDKRLSPAALAAIAIFQESVRAQRLERDPVAART